MGRPRRYDRRIQIGIRIPESLHRMLESASKNRDISMNQLASKAIEKYLRELPRLEDDPRLRIKT